MKKPLILAIETSCDETSVAVVRGSREVLANEIFSQIPLHRELGGVVPEVAARAHLPKILPLVRRALEVSGVKKEELAAIAATVEPGLIGSLLVGIETARWLALIWKKPFLPVNHIDGHLASVELERGSPTRWPVVALSVSGGHNELFLLRSPREKELLGETLDDAAGEAFDKAARLLGLGYPGGPEISRAAARWKEKEEELFVKSQKLKVVQPLPRPFLSPSWRQEENFNFSFSGLKTALLRELEKEGEISPARRDFFAWDFEEAATEPLAEKLAVAARRFSAREVWLTGGVSANQRLREKIAEKLDAEFSSRPAAEKPVFLFPRKLSFCGDNAAMIGAAAFFFGEEESFKES